MRLFGNELEEMRGSRLGVGGAGVERKPGSESGNSEHAGMVALARVIEGWTALRGLLRMVMVGGVNVPCRLRDILRDARCLMCA